MEEEFELVPLSPIRRIERRLERVEKTGTASETTKELLDVVTANQRVIDSVIKINSDMMTRIADLMTNVGELTKKLEDFISKAEIVNEESERGEEKAEIEKKIDERLAKVEKRVNAMILSTMRPRLKRE